MKYLHLQESETIPIPIKGRPAHHLPNAGIVAVSGGKRRPRWAPRGLQGETKCKNKRTPPRRRVLEGKPPQGASLLEGAGTASLSCRSVGARHTQKRTSGKDNKSVGWGETFLTSPVRSLNTAFFSFLPLCALQIFVMVSLFQILQLKASQPGMRSFVRDSRCAIVTACLPVL